MYETKAWVLYTHAHFLSFFSFFFFLAVVVVEIYKVFMALL